KILAVILLQEVPTNRINRLPFAFSTMGCRVILISLLRIPLILKLTLSIIESWTLSIFKTTTVQKMRRTLLFIAAVVIVWQQCLSTNLMVAAIQKVDGLQTICNFIKIGHLRRLLIRMLRSP